MKWLTLILLAFLVVAEVFAQGTITGHVYYQNSDWTPAIGIPVKAAGSNGDYSKADGAFSLQFPQLSVGTSVYLGIGDNNLAQDEQGKSVELVNAKELELVTIPLHPQTAPLKIVVCPRGERDLAAQRYYKILKSSSDQQLEEKQKILDALSSKFAQNSKVLLQQENELQILRELADSVQIYKEAMSIASINRDGASERISEYLTLLDAGISVQDARKVLNVDAAFQEGNNSLAALQSSIDEIDRYWAQSLRNGQFEDALNQLDTLIELVDHALVNKKILSLNLIAGAAVCAQLGIYWTDEQGKYSYERGLTYSLRAQQVNKEFLPKDTLALITAQYYHGTFLLHDNQEEEAEQYLTSAFELSKQFAVMNQENGKAMMINSSYMLGVLYQKKRDFNSSIHWLQRSDDFMQRFAEAGILDAEQKSWLSKKLQICQILSKNYKEQYLFHRAEKYLLRQLILIKEKINSTGSSGTRYFAELFAAHQSLISFYIERHKFVQAEEFYEQSVKLYDALDVEEKEFHNGTMSGAFVKLAKLYEANEQQGLAESKFREYIDFCNQASSSDESMGKELAFAHETIAKYYHRQDRIEEAYNNFRVALDKEKQYFSKAPDVHRFSFIISLQDAGDFFQNIDSLPAAEAAYLEAYALTEYYLSSEAKERFARYTNSIKDQLLNFYSETKQPRKREHFVNRYLGHLLKLALDEPKSYFSQYLVYKKNIGEFYLEKDEVELARNIFESLVQDGDRLGYLEKDKLNSPWTRLQLANFHKSQQQYAIANKYFLQRIQITTDSINFFNDEHWFRVNLLECYLPLLESKSEQLELTNDPAIQKESLDILSIVDQLLAQENKYPQHLEKVKSKIDPLRQYFQEWNTAGVVAEQWFQNLLNLETEINNSADHAKKKKLILQLIQDLKTRKSSFDSDSLYQVTLGNWYGALSWSSLFTKSFAEAEQAARTGLSMSHQQEWIHTNLALSLLHQDQTTAAKIIYYAYKNRSLEANDITAAFLADLDSLEAVGIFHSEYPTIRKLLQEDDDQMAMEFFNSAIEDERDDLAERYVGLAYNQRGLLHYQQQNYQAALADQQKSLDIALNNFDTLHLETAYCYYELGKVEQALGLYKTSLEHHEQALAIREKLLPEYDIAIFNSWIYINKNSRNLEFHIAAINNLLVYSLAQRQIENGSENAIRKWKVENYLQLALTYWQTQNYESALYYLHAALQIKTENSRTADPSLIRIYAALGHTYYALEEFQDALYYQQLANKGIELCEDLPYPARQISLWQLAKIQEKLGHTDLANSTLQKWRALHDQKQFKFINLEELQIFTRSYLARGRHLQTKNFNWALDDYDFILEFTDSDYSYFLKGLCHYYLEDYSLAIEAYQKSVSINPDLKDANWHNNIGLAYLKNGQFNQAKKAFDECANGDLDPGRLQRNWTMYYALKNNIPKAFESMAEAIRLGYTDKGWWVNEKSLATLRQQERFQELLNSISDN